ncbi:FAD:protein FMN transferase [Croceivirga lutea]|uniref:FAD:protein FMN transferase n=1 Tax=Croceivirga lutea TaxID=1775167 RepID=UPI00163A8BEE|nr:FAD:protein FMN transferase [Croceivirga lutea]GGG50378.1 FAD:protein FMN transferase [Croceivirga lutea]
MRKWFVVIVSLLTLGVYAQDNDPFVSVNKVLKLMGTRFEITVVAANEEIGYININEAVAEIERIEKLISSWNINSETSEINRFAGMRPVKVSQELFDLIKRAINIAKITDGAFDITYASMDKIWKFDGSMKVFPSEERIKNSIAKVGFEKVVLNESELTVYLPEKGMKIGFGAIGKGYAADKTKKLLISKGVKAGLINAGGDLTSWGTKETGEKWLVGITNPLDKDKVFSWLPIVESSVATSGNYEKFVHFKGKKYTHIINPRTGYPTTGVKSVTIFAKDAELCDALATAVYVMGVDAGLHFINQLDGVEVLVVDDENEIHKSSGVVLDKSTNFKK